MRTSAAVTSAMAATRGSSAFRTASPSAGSAAGSSAFALAIRSMLPARSRWVGCTASTTPTSGRAISASRAISPTVYMLISRTAASCVGSSRSRVIGSPVSELRFPSFRSVVSSRERTSAVISLAIVLPVEPVMPTTRTAWRDRHQAARSWRARSASGTTTWGASRRSAGRSTGRSTSTAEAPARSASATNACPSARSPGSATKMDPGLTRRESTDAPVIEDEAIGAGPWSRPRVAPSTSSRRIVGGTRTPLRTSVESSVVMAGRPGPVAGPAGSRGSRAPGA